MIIARWTYSADEWKSFLFRHKKRKNLLHVLIGKAKPLPKIPEVVFTSEKVSIGNQQLSLQSPGIKEINLYEEGEVNVMRFVFEKMEVPILIPKGKLREALDLRKKLQALL